MANSNILIVEDDRDIRETMREAFEIEGYQVQTAENGKHALDLLGGGAKPDLILLDLMMPVMDGWEMLKEKQANPQIVDIPVVIITAGGVKQNVNYPHPVVKKPVDLMELLDIVEKYKKVN